MKKTTATVAAMASKLYTLALARQQKSIAPDIEQAIQALVTLVGYGHGWITAYREVESQSLVSAVLVLEAKGVANMILNLVSPKWRSLGLLSHTTDQCIHEAKNRECHTFDFNGANSPLRGDDKHSYGAAPVLFFNLRYVETLR